MKGAGAAAPARPALWTALFGGSAHGAQPSSIMPRAARGVRGICARDARARASHPPPLPLRPIRALFADGSPASSL